MNIRLFLEYEYLFPLLDPISETLPQAFHPPAALNLQKTILSPDKTVVTEGSDLSTLFKLFRDSSSNKLINLADWYTAFKVIKDEDNNNSQKKRRGSKGKGNSEGVIGSEEREIQARFVRAIGDMAVMGFIGPTSRKQEHVARLVW
jgi:hypothetical protein